MLACKDTCEHWTVQHKARIVAAQAAEKPRRGEFELHVGHLFTQIQNLEVSI